MEKPIIALLYDFDKTLCTTDMEDYTFIPALGYQPAEFWKKANTFGFTNRMDGLLAYMYTMIEECRAQNIRLDRDFLVRCGHGIELFPGVKDWFGRINAFGRSLGVDVEHYVISSGLREIIEGSGISHEFKEITPASFSIMRKVWPPGPSWMLISPIRPSLSTASIRVCWTCPTTVPLTPPCPMTASASLLPT